MRRSEGVTLLEVLYVVIVISILIMAALPSYKKTMDKADDKEAAAGLFLLQNAERIYKIDTGIYYGGLTISGINTNLKVFLPQNATRHWNFTVYSTGCVQATRSYGDAKVWHLHIADSEPAATVCN